MNKLISPAIKIFPTAALLLTLIIAPFAAADMTGKVVKIQDGDTITILDKHNVQHRIRLAQIDAPESNQPWGAKSKGYLTGRLAGKTVVVVSSGIDRYKRVLGTVFLSGVNINEEQVKTGNAWVYTQYATDKSLFEIEKQARNNKAGLWKLPENERIAPWIWRRTKKH